MKTPPQSYYNTGGILQKGGAPTPSGGYASAGEAVAEQRTTNNLLVQVVTRLDNVDGNTAATAAHAASTAASNEALVGYGPPRVAIGHGEAMQIEETRQQALDSLAAATLGGGGQMLRKLGWRGSIR